MGAGDDFSSQSRGGEASTTGREAGKPGPVPVLLITGYLGAGKTTCATSKSTLHTFDIPVAALLLLGQELSEQLLLLRADSHCKIIDSPDASLWMRALTF